MDEERTYIYIFRFLSLYQHLHKTMNDKLFVELRFKKDADKAMLQLEELRHHLIARYKELEDEKALLDLNPSSKTNVDIAVVAPEPIFKNG